tara:strand:+ start:167 stop:721 length:555 start_codon:yes stop_codon:yes gene_type:complete
MKKSLDIPAINNKLEALAKFLGINSEVEAELSTIEQRHIISPVHTYKHNNTMYYVANSSYGLGADKLVEFNSHHWSILAEKKEAPYVRFYDAKVMTQLRSVSPDGYKILAINQKEHKVLFRTQGGFLVVFRFQSHVPNDISTYHFVGSVTDSLRDIDNVFTGNYKIQNSDEMLHDQTFEVMAMN